MPVDIKPNDSKIQKTDFDRKMNYKDALLSKKNQENWEESGWLGTKTVFLKFEYEVYSPTTLISSKFQNFSMEGARPLH
jgi:hypothetical protein